jgi:hypothetical protein
LPAAAQLLGDAKVGFTADRTVTYDGRTFQGKVWSMPGHQRHEQQIEGIQQVILLKSDGQGFLVVPQMRSYVDFRFSPAIAELSDPALLKTAVGQETVSGLKTTKYRIEPTARDGTFVEGWMWRTADGIIAKLDGTVTSRGGKSTPISMSLSNVRTGTQDAALFDVPQGMMKLPANALQPLLGATGKM